MFYDLGIRTRNIEELVPLAKKLGWNGLGVIIDLKDIGKIEKVSKGIDVCFGVEIKPKNVSSLKRDVQKIRKRAEIILVSGGDLDINRKALETPEVDILTNPWGSLENPRNDPGINHISARIAKENNVAVCFDFRNILHTHQKRRTSMFRNFLGAAKLIKKYKAPFIISSGALSVWDIRSPSELSAFGKNLGFDKKEITKAMSDSILKENRKRLGGKWIMPGVELE